jgi:hypothetical protein
LDTHFALWSAALLLIFCCSVVRRPNNYSQKFVIRRPM